MSTCRARPALLLLCALSPGPLASAQPLLRLPDLREGWPVGTCTHRFVDREGPATAALDQLGAPWVRVDFDWNGIEPVEGGFDWSNPDAVVDSARAHGLLVYATLAYTPQWATDGPLRSGVPRSPEHYRHFVAAVVERYRDRVKHWGLWNEPENAHFWAGSAQQLIDLVLRPGFEAVRAADPEALVLGPDSGNDDWLDQIFSAGGGQYLDVITVHVYACCDGTDNVHKVLQRLDCVDQWFWEPCRRSVIEDHGLLDKGVWLTEVGWKTLSPEWEQRQADYYTQLLDEMALRPWWRKTIFYELYDETPCDPAVDNCWGILWNDWQPKPAFGALRDYLAQHQPRADAGADRVATVGVPVLFDASASTDPDGALVGFAWDFDQGDGVTADATSASVSHVFPSVGIYTVTLVVSDDQGYQDADVVVVQVAPASADAGPQDTGGGGDAGSGDAGGGVDSGAPGRDASAGDDVGSGDGAPALDAPTPDGAATDAIASDSRNSIDAEARESGSAPPDAAARGEGGSPPPEPGTGEAGCQCAAAAGGTSAPWLIAVLFLALLRVTGITCARSQRRRRGRSIGRCDRGRQYRIG